MVGARSAGKLWAGMVAEVSAKALIDLQNEVLERVAYGHSLTAIGDMVCRGAEAIAPEATCSILTVDRDLRLRPLAAPSMPIDVAESIDGLKIGPLVGSCGTAAYRGEAVEVQDIENDILWRDYRDLALRIGLRACWSTPIKARDGRVIGTFAFYFRTCRGPTELEREVVARCTHLCAIAIEHGEMQLRMHELAYLDALTALPNRASFGKRIEEMTGQDRPFALLLVDLDHLKEVNDGHGHAFGDALIRTVADRLMTTDATMEAFRLGGDEFAVILPGCAKEGSMATSAHSLICMLSAPFEHEGHVLRNQVTVGGALFEPGCTADTLYQNADFALYHGKDSDRGGFVPFRPGMRTAITNRIAMIRELGQALADARLFPMYQPVVRIDTAEIVGVESLARFLAPDGKIVQAGDFKDVLSDSRIGPEVTLHMLRAIAEDVRRWLDMGIPFQHVGINVSDRDFQKGDLAQRIADAFRSAGVPLSHVILEVNETVFMGGRDKYVARAVEMLRADGIRVALDDFGTGFASLTHLLSFPVDVIKIDKSFVDRLMHDRPSLIIVAGLIDIARKLNMKVVAEGIETIEQAEVLLSLGCTLGQGHRYARALTADTATQMLLRFSQRTGEARAFPPLPFRGSA